MDGGDARGDTAGVRVDGAGHASGAARPQRWLHRDTPRAWAAVAISLPAVVALQIGWVLVTSRQLTVLTGSLASWASWSVAYLVLMHVAYRRSRAADLPALTARPPLTRWRKAFGYENGPGFGVQVGVVALATAALLPRTAAVVPVRSERQLLVGLIVVTVVTAWLVVVTSYTVFYARRDLAGGGLAFPGETRPGYVDYFYFALAVATTFGTTDVTVTTPRMRRSVSAHAALAFVFNTVIIALLVSALST